MTYQEFEMKVKSLEQESLAICKKLLSKKLVILPAGKMHRLIIRELGVHGIYPDFIADANPLLGEKGAWLYNNRKYFQEKTDEIIYKYGNDVNYMIASRPFREEIKSHLLESGIKEENIFVSPVVRGDLVSPVGFNRRLEIYSNFEEIVCAANYLEDIDSRETFWELLAICSACTPIWMEKQWSEEYFNTPYLKIGGEEVFVDAGVFDGKTIKRFIELCPDYKYIYGIEANKENMDIIYENLRGCRDVSILHKALCNSEKLLRFGKIRGEGAMLHEEGEDVVEGMRGDTLQIEPTFIKFDIEGAEFDALCGFEKTIQKYRPKMAISIYHSLRDHWRLINEVKRICPEYKLNICHHYTYEILYGTILYAHI